VSRSGDPVIARDLVIGRPPTTEARLIAVIADIARDRRDRGKGKSFTAKDAKDAE